MSRLNTSPPGSRIPRAMVLTTLGFLAPLVRLVVLVSCRRTRFGAPPRLMCRSRCRHLAPGRGEVASSCHAVRNPRRSQPELPAGGTWGFTMMMLPLRCNAVLVELLPLAPTCAAPFPLSLLHVPVGLYLSTLSASLNASTIQACDRRPQKRPCFFLARLTCTIIARLSYRFHTHTLSLFSFFPCTP